MGQKGEIHAKFLEKTIKLTVVKLKSVGEKKKKKLRKKKPQSQIQKKPKPLFEIILALYHHCWLRVENTGRNTRTA